MVFLRKTLYILLWLIVISQWLPAQTLTTEEEQQFSYYWYAAKQAITEERFADAYVLLEFCHMIKPDDGTTLMFLGVMYEGMGRKDRALETFRLAFEAAPRDQWYKYSEALLAQRTEEGNKEARGFPRAESSTRAGGSSPARRNVSYRSTRI